MSFFSYNKNIKQTKNYESILYTNILSLSRNKVFYTKFDLSDTFQNRIHLIFIHISFLMIKVNNDEKKSTYKVFYQKLFDFLFKQIDLNMREIGFGDVVINKNMKFLVKSFYSTLLYCENYKKKSSIYKNNFFIKSLKSNNSHKLAKYEQLIDYFDKYEAFCFDLSSDSVLKGEINFNYK